MGNKTPANVEDYEALYRRELDTNSALREKMLASEVKLREAYSELEKLRAQMEVVEHVVVPGVQPMDQTGTRKLEWSNAAKRNELP